MIDFPRKYSQLTRYHIQELRLAASTDAAIHAMNPHLKPTPGHVPAAMKLAGYEAWCENNILSNRFNVIR